MAPQVEQLEQVMRQLVAEHEKLLCQLEAQHAAMKKLDLKAMQDLAAAQDQTRLRIGSLDARRRLVAGQIAAWLKLPPDATVPQIAQRLPSGRERLLSVRDELRSVMQRVSGMAHVAGRVAGAVLGHLNTAMRLMAGAVEQAGLYTKHGAPQVSGRIGVMEAVG